MSNDLWEDLREDGLKRLKELQRISMREFEEQYMNIPRNLEPECETYALKSHIHCPEKAFEREIYGDKHYFCDKCWETLNQINDWKLKMQSKFNIDEQ